METTEEDQRRTIVVGDVHGCIDELRQLLRDVRHDPARDRLIFVGDLVDRGPDPVGVVRLVRELAAESTLGNHEDKHIRFAAHEAKRAATGKKNPMRPFDPERLAQHHGLSAEDRAWLVGLPTTIRFGRFIVTHAGFAADAPIAEQEARKVVRTRNVDATTGAFVASHRPAADAKDEPAPGTVYWTERWRGPESVIYGHAVHGLEEPRIDEPVPGVRCYGIDTGCVFGGTLTAMIVAGDEVAFAKVKAARRYFARRSDDET